MEVRDGPVQIAGLLVDTTGIRRTKMPVSSRRDDTGIDMKKFWQALYGGLRLRAFFQRFHKLTQVILLLLPLIERERTVGIDRNAAKKMKRVAVPVVKFITPLVDFFPPIAHRAPMQAGASRKIVFFIPRVV